MRVAGIIPVNNVAERGLRGLALGRKSWLFAGSERGAERAAVMARRRPSVHRRHASNPARRPTPLELAALVCEIRGMSTMSWPPSQRAQ
jgi:hypothetical protein